MKASDKFEQSKFIVIHPKSKDNTLLINRILYHMARIYAKNSAKKQNTNRFEVYHSSIFDQLYDIKKNSYDNNNNNNGMPLLLPDSTQYLVWSYADLSKTLLKRLKLMQ